ncbi:unnamed protein product [Schistocephalus solidus]|uniref:Uncharacterized protein n=1 Tax=Schistocephalus solidus TaxID=70667 RepID=A0A183SJ37_SCHSO|nr:unnamed protein product [Schistocephalus solidus]
MPEFARAMHADETMTTSLCRMLQALGHRSLTRPTRALGIGKHVGRIGLELQMVVMPLLVLSALVDAKILVLEMGDLSCGQGMLQGHLEEISEATAHRPGDLGEPRPGQTSMEKKRKDWCSNLRGQPDRRC